MSYIAPPQSTASFHQRHTSSPAVQTIPGPLRHATSPLYHNQQSILQPYAREESILDHARRAKCSGLRELGEGPTGVQHRKTIPSDHSASYYPGDHGRRSTQNAALLLSLSIPHQIAPYTESRPSTPPSAAKLATRSPTGRSVKARVPDRSFPIQEEDEEDDAYGRIDNREQAPDRVEDVHDPRRQHHASSPPTSLADTVAAYNHGYPRSPLSRPGAPIPPSPSHPTSTSPSPSPVISEMSQAKGKKPVLPQYCPAPRADSPYPFPFAHIQRGLCGRERSQDLRGQSETGTLPHVGSAQPQDISIELLTVEEAPGECRRDEHGSEPHHSSPRPAQDESADDEDEDEDEDADAENWIDEDVGIKGVAEDLLRPRFHPGDHTKRCRRWDLLWEDLLRAFRALDLETNAPLILLAAPSHTGKLHFAKSQAVHRDSSFKLKKMRTSFAEMASRQRAAHPPSLLEQLSRSISSSSRDGLPTGSSSAREEHLRRTLNTAIGSFHALRSLYERREMWWSEEKLKLDEEKERVQRLLKEAFSAISLAGPAL
ncbi:hypothetical protein EI94DRAFT_1730873 [Lactarius quietus]|nr:hypothetical protein EI94DRAFT_1730873 [Lactarius quietus]